MNQDSQRIKKNSQAHKKIQRLFDRCNFADYTFSPSFIPSYTVSSPPLSASPFTSLLRRRAALPSLRAALYSTLAPTWSRWSRGRWVHKGECGGMRWNRGSRVWCSPWGWRGWWG